MARPQKKTLEPWQQEDANRLKELWDRRDPPISQETAAFQWGIGTQGLLWQYISGTIPLNLPVALKFAAGLNCQVYDISPTLWGLIEELYVNLSPKQKRALVERLEAVGEKAWLKKRGVNTHELNEVIQ